MNEFVIPHKEGPVKKNMQKVYDYEARKQLQIFRGQCFNVSGNLMTSLNLVDKPIRNVVNDLFNLAQELYDVGIERNWLKLKEDE